MELTDAEMAFLARRTKLVRTWPAVGWALLGAVVALGAWLVVTRPLLADPFTALAQLEAGSIPPSMLKLMAGLLPVVVLLCLVLVAVIVAFVFAAMANERRHLAIIRRLSEAPVR